MNLLGMNFILNKGLHEGGKHSFLGDISIIPNFWAEVFDFSEFNSTSSFVISTARSHRLAHHPSYMKPVTKGPTL